MLLVRGRDLLGFRKSDRLKLLQCLAFLILLLPYVTAAWDPYEIIGVKRDASTEQIKRAYRDLARKLHPDKSNLNEEESGRKFIELNKAFNILKDPEKRSRYDQHGETEDSRRAKGQHGWYHQNGRGRESWTQNGYRTFTFYTNMDSTLRRSSITSWQFHNEYIKASTTRPFFIFFYADFCPSCSMIEGAWSKIINELAKFNIGSFTINVHQESRLSQDLGISSIPHIACLIDGHIRPYYQPELSLAKIVKFTKTLLPNDLVVTLSTDKDQDSFIALGPSKNKLSAIIVHNENNLKLRFLLLAFGLRQYYRFGHISTKFCQYNQISKQYNLTIKTDSQMAHLLVFDEDFKSPKFKEKFEFESQEYVQTHRKLMRWPFLKLPKIFSQDRFDDLCVYSIPRDGERTKQRLCVILFAPDTSYGSLMRKRLIDFINFNNLERDDKIVFAFIDPVKQNQFVDSLLEETRINSPVKQDVVDSCVILLERHQQHNQKAYYKWLSSRWDPNNLDEIDKAKVELYDAISDYRLVGAALYNKVGLDPLINEEGPTLLGKILWRSIDYLSKGIAYVTSRETSLTVMLLMVGALIAYISLHQTSSSTLDSSDYSSHNSNNRKTNQRNDQSNDSAHDQDELRILELKAETYNGMVRLLKPGYRSIVLLTDMKAKENLISQFRKAVWPYRRNKTLNFGYLCLDKNLDWYKHLLQQVLGVSELKVNKKYCIGTVLSLNGFKKYFRVYHAKHHEIDCHDDDTANDGSFLGFDDRDDDDLESGTSVAREQSDTSKETCNGNSYPIEDLLKRLPIWLDKMFDGMTKRYFIDQWPEEMN